MTDTKELAPLKEQVSALEQQAQSVVIETPDQYKGAVDLVSKLKDIGSQITNKKESITKPLNVALKNARDLFRPIEDQFETAVNIVKGKILTYKQKVDAEARAKEAEIAAKIEAGKIQLKTAERRMEKIERIDTTTKGEVGQVQIKKIKKVRIIDEAALPREYLVPDKVAIRRDALGGKLIPGVEIYEEETVAAGSF